MSAFALPRPSRDTVTLAVVYTVLAHLVVWWFLPRDLPPLSTGIERFPDRVRVQLDEFVMVDPVEEMNFIRAPLDVPEEVPEETTNISDRDQQAAQEEESPLGFDNMPFVEGDMPDSNRVAQGDPFQAPIPMPVPPQPEEAAEEQETAEPAPNAEPSAPLPNLASGDPASGDGLIVVEEAGEAESLPEEDIPLALIPNANEEQSPLDGQGEAATDTLPTESTEAREAPPRPRPRLPVRDNSYGPLRDNRHGVARMGRVAVDAEYSEFGVYNRRLIEIIERRWRGLVQSSRALQFTGSRITIRFDVDRQGRIVNLEVLEDAAGALPLTLSNDAITAPAPFDEWTPEMILKGDDEMTFTITFFY